ncbi:MAG TPA: hypothetical protein VNJ09_00755, partial [Chthonomonadales bacterium]|nr:hypothetical protein [Chthonomonadales bacterium]
NNRWRTNFDDSAFAWASLKNFWCVKGRYLARQDANTSSFNFVIGRPEPKCKSSKGDSWLAGRRASQNVKPESKKVFSFKEPENVRRTFGFVRNENEFQQMQEKLEALRDGDRKERKADQVWKDFNPEKDFLKGEQILDKLF